MNEELIILGKRIADLRNKRGFTQDKLAELMDYSTNHVAKLESARTNPSFALLVKLCNALQIEMKELFDSDEYVSIEHTKNELQKLLNSNNSKTIKLLYKIYRSIDI